MRLNATNRRQIAQVLTDAIYNKANIRLEKRENALGDDVYRHFVTEKQEKTMNGLPTKFMYTDETIQIDSPEKTYLCYLRMSGPRRFPVFLHDRVIPGRSLMSKINRFRTARHKQVNARRADKRARLNKLNQYTTVEKLLASYPLWKKAVNKALGTDY